MAGPSTRKEEMARSQLPRERGSRERSTTSAPASTTKDSPRKLGSSKNLTRARGGGAITVAGREDSETETSSHDVRPTTVAKTRHRTVSVEAEKFMGWWS